jgi:hypothetical protein
MSRVNKILIGSKNGTKWYGLRINEKTNGLDLWLFWREAGEIVFLWTSK